MAEGKKSFILYCDLIHTISKLPDEKAGQLFKHILDYVNDKDPQTDDLVISIAFEPIKQQLKRDLNEWNGKKSTRSEAGKIGAAKRWQNMANDAIAINDMAKMAVNVNVNDNVNVNVNEEVDTAAAPEIVLNVEKCTEIALKDERWVNANKTNKSELTAFNAFLEAQGVYLKNPADYKKHFSNWKKKKPAEKPNTVPVENKPKTLKERYLSPLLREGITLNEWEAEFDRLRPNLEAVDLTYINQSYIRGEPKWKKAVLQEFFKR
jgi:hypothetical protein